MSNQIFLTTIIHTKNSAATLTKCLDSVSWSDEILVVDMGSSDNTLSIAEKFKCRILTVKDQKFADPLRNYAVDKAKGNWVLVVDSDEYVSLALQRKIQEILIAPQADVYWLCRQNWIFGKWIQHTGWWPDYQPRLFLKGQVKWGDHAHTFPVTKGKSEYLPADPTAALIHHNFPTVESYLERLDRYTTLQAEQSVDFQDAKLYSESSVLKEFSGDFFRRFFAENGWQDGTHGLVLSLYQSVYQLTTRVKMWQKTGFVTDLNFAGQSANDPESITALEEMRQELSYWLATWKIDHTQGINRWWWRLRRRLRV